MRDCSICFNQRSNFKNLSCSHELCVSCFKKLHKTQCPYCRKNFTLDEIRDKIPIKIKKKMEAPILIFTHHVPFSRAIKNCYRRRRKNLTLQQVLERRASIKKRMKKKWTRKNKHLRRFCFN